MIDNIILQLAFQRNQTSQLKSVNKDSQTLGWDAWNLRYRPICFEALKFYNALFFFYSCISMNTRILIIVCDHCNCELCTWIVPCTVWLLFRTFWNHVRLKQYLNINNLLQSETIRLRTIPVKPFYWECYFYLSLLLK